MKVDLKKLRPKVVYSDKFLNAISILMKVGGFAIFPFAILRERLKGTKSGARIINHESIHFQQALELGVIPFYMVYVLEWAIKSIWYRRDAYMDISFEQEAYANESNLNYLDTRVRYNWVFLIFNKK